MERKILNIIGATTLSAILILPGLALAALDRIEEAFELDLTQVTLPAHQASQVVIRECGSCDLQIFQVDGYTSYFIRSQPVTLAVLLDAAQSVSDRENTLVVVNYSTATEIVTKIRLFVDE